jgi:hypothetical protein
MIKIGAIIAGALLMAGAALAGTLTSLDSTNSPTIGTTVPLAISTVSEEDRSPANDPGKDLRGPCDEAEHANDPRCAGAPAAGSDETATHDRGADTSAQGSSGPGPSSGPNDRSGHDDNSGHGSGNGNGSDD